MSMQYLAQTMTEESHPFRMVGFVVAKFATLGLISWRVYRAISKRRRHGNAIPQPPRQPAPSFYAPYPPHAGGPWVPPNANGAWGSPQWPYVPPAQPGQHPAWPTPPARHAPPLTNWYR
ncbi:hypothetical protein CIW49_26735 [Mycolicibacterium sp. P1-18]|uniref:hypothetical protein n=1 Tax=Mycolicibacterium sp. P1-18 TaxID=2024615 RepID=UPI0011F0C7ED|nr:hypothetical protein [Mycolicibacterium sp. P1-18]KAA0093647.1 hypothetical protein CIW49_26735 [Mycolicibacterium sp. P1-18]